MAKFGEEDEGGGGEEALGAKGAALFNKRMAAAPLESEDGTVTVQEPEEDDDLDETPEAPSRKERRSQRGADRVSARERAAAAEARAAVLQEQLDAARRAPVAPLGQQRQQGNPYEHIDAEIRKTFQEEKALNAKWVATSAKASAAEIQRMEDEAAELVVRRQGLIVDRKEVERAPRRAEEARIHDQRSRFPDVFADTRAFQYAQGTYNQALARGEADSRELQDAAFLEARQVILGKRPAPDQATRQRASGVSSGVRPTAVVDRPKISMPKGSDYDRIARAAFPKLDPAEARQRWANTVGKKLIAKQG